MRICRDGISLESYNASTREDHTGSRANWWLSEIDRQSHTCLMDEGIHVVDGKTKSGKLLGQQPILFTCKNTWNRLESGEAAS